MELPRGHALLVGVAIGCAATAPPAPEPPPGPVSIETGGDPAPAVMIETVGWSRTDVESFARQMDQASGAHTVVFAVSERRIELLPECKPGGRYVSSSVRVPWKDDRFLRTRTELAGEVGGFGFGTAAELRTDEVVGGTRVALATIERARRLPLLRSELSADPAACRRATHSLTLVVRGTQSSVRGKREEVQGYLSTPFARASGRKERTALQSSEAGREQGDRLAPLLIGLDPVVEDVLPSSATSDEESKFSSDARAERDRMFTFEALGFYGPAADCQAGAGLKLGSTGFVDGSRPDIHAVREAAVQFLARNRGVPACATFFDRLKLVLRRMRAPGNVRAAAAVYDALDEVERAVDAENPDRLSVK